MKRSVIRTRALAIFACLLLPHFSLAQDPNAGRDLAASCFACHGTNGNSVGGVPPSLAGRDRTELLQTMKDFQSGKRPATMMQHQAKGYTDAQLALIADYLAGLKAAPARVPSKGG